jgi:hypothetical protein
VNNRREFLKGLAATAAGLYVPTKEIFLPPEGGWPVKTVHAMPSFGYYRRESQMRGIKNAVAHGHITIENTGRYLVRWALHTEDDEDELVGASTMALIEAGAGDEVQLVFNGHTELIKMPCDNDYFFEE